MQGHVSIVIGDIAPGLLLPMNTGAITMTLRASTVVVERELDPNSMELLLYREVLHRPRSRRISIGSLVSSHVYSTVNTPYIICEIAA